MIEYLFGAAAILVLVRLVKGPTFADRMISADVLINIVVFLTVYYTLTQNVYLIDIAITIALLSFFGTIAVAKYVIK